MCIVLHRICYTTKPADACMLSKPCYIDNACNLGVFNWMNNKLHVVNQWPSIVFRLAVFIFNFLSTGETMDGFLTFLNVMLVKDAIIVLRWLWNFMISMEDNDWSDNQKINFQQYMWLLV